MAELWFKVGMKPGLGTCDGRGFSRRGWAVAESRDGACLDEVRGETEIISLFDDRANDAFAEPLNCEIRPSGLNSEEWQI